MRRITRDELIYGPDSVNCSINDIRRLKRAKKKFVLLINLGPDNDNFFTQSNNVDKLLDAAVKYSKGITADKLTLVINN